jgi:hypothetical protein
VLTGVIGGALLLYGITKFEKRGESGDFWLGSVFGGLLVLAALFSW